MEVGVEDAAEEVDTLAGGEVCEVVTAGEALEREQLVAAEPAGVVVSSVAEGRAGEEGLGDGDEVVTQAGLRGEYYGIISAANGQPRWGGRLGRTTTGTYITWVKTATVSRMLARTTLDFPMCLKLLNDGTPISNHRLPSCALAISDRVGLLRAWKT